MNVKLVIIIVLLITQAACAPKVRLAENPKVASYWTSPRMSVADAAHLAKMHLVIADMENQANNPDSLKLLKKLNPKLKLLAYANPMEIWVPMVKPRPLAEEMAAGLEKREKWRLKTPQGEPVIFWKGMQMLNLSTACPEIAGERYNQHAARFLVEKVLANGIWDGFFLDNSGGNISWVNSGRIDADNDGNKDDPRILDQQWSDGIREFISIIRKAKGPDFIMVGNKGSVEFLDVLDGKMFEEAPNDYLGDKKAGGWYQTMENYFQTGPFSIMHARQGEEGYVKFVSASALLGDGLFAYRQNETYEKQDFPDIGKALEKAYRADDGSWHRKFERAEVVVWPEAGTGEIKYK